MNHNFKKQNKQEGITLFITLLITGVLLAVSSSLLNITLKQFQFSSISEISEKAFYAANSGMECALFHDHILNKFDIPGDGGSSPRLPAGSNAGPNCMGAGAASDALKPLDSDRSSGEEQRFEISWDDVCTKISVYKFFNTNADEDMSSVVAGRTCAQGLECTVVASRGYNAPCNSLTGSKVVEREITIVY